MWCPSTTPARAGSSRHSRVTLDVRAGTSVAVTGPSGCGKSTLLAVLGGLLLPTSGDVWLGGTRISRLSEARRVHHRRHELGLVFQTDNLLPFLTVRENVGLCMALVGETDQSVGLDLLERLGLVGELDELPDRLSGGQRQRVAVARA